jgi:azobenzene reductase
MNILIVSGSHRDKAQSLKVSKWLGAVLKDKGAKPDVLDLYGEPLPMWDDTAWNPESDLAKQAAKHTDRVSAADAIILVAPEWGGMVPAGLKNFLLYVSSKHAAHKPAMIVGVSAGRGGTYPIAELRMSGFKNNRMVYTPDHLIVQDVNNVMNSAGVDEGAEADQYIKKRAVYSLDILLAYAKALKPMREAGGLFNPAYPFGM